MEAEGSLFEIAEKALQAITDAAESDFRPGNILRANQSDLKTFFSWMKFRRSQAAAVKEVNLIDVGNAGH